VLKQRLLAHQQQDRVKTREIRGLQRKLGVRTRKAQELGQQLLGMEQRAMELEEVLRGRASRLRRSKQRTQRSTKQRLKGLLPPKQR
jgi:hypothetical protein